MPKQKPEPKAVEKTIFTIKDVIFMFSSVSRPVEQLNTENKPPLSDTESPTFHLEFHSYEIKILISDNIFKALKKKFKGAKNITNAKDFEKEELLEKYDYLDPDILDDEMWLVKFSQSCLVGKPNKDGERRESYPISQIGIKGKVQDLHGNTIDQDTNIGNGTRGHFQFRPVDGKNGLYLYPHLLCITELVEYTPADREEDFESLGLQELDETELEEMNKKNQVPEQDEDDNDEDEEEMFN